ncbi:MAG: metallophosphoesterase [Clostridia bacterium]|nr:metallophosphoesterase [Clostridia bacterium]
MYKFQTTEYKLNTACFGRELRFALVSDLHSSERTQIDGILSEIRRQSPDYILMAGDILERLDGSAPQAKRAGFELMRELCAIAPVLYSIGNHENGGTGSWNILKWKLTDGIPKSYDEREMSQISELGVNILDDDMIMLDGIAFCGLTSGIINKGQMPNLEVVKRLCELECPKVLLCHHPEYYSKYLSDSNIDLVVSGHAHGGQWRIFGRGVFAPNQGIFPKYTSGVHDGRHIISRGLVPSRGIVPRIFNRPELVFIIAN